MGAFTTLSQPADRAPVWATVISEPSVTTTAVAPKSWCSLLELSPESGAGALVWQAAQSATTLEGMTTHVRDADAPGADKRAARNHLELADAWGVFGPDGITAQSLGSGEITVLDVSGLDTAPMNAVCRAVADRLYRARINGEIDRLPWLLVDEAHAFFDGVALPALERLLTRGRAPGVSIAIATQRPSAVPQVAVSQSDLLLAHRLTAEADLAALDRARPTYLSGSFVERLPTEPGETLIVDDATESVHTARIRQRATPHGGGSPSASEVRIDCD